jgi:hypothetical protein
LSTDPSLKPRKKNFIARDAIHDLPNVKKYAQAKNVGKKKRKR